MLEYLFDECALTPMPPSMLMVLMFLKMEHWNVCLMFGHLHPSLLPCRGCQCFWRWSIGISFWCVCTKLPCRGFQWNWSIGISVWCVCTNTHASFHAERFNGFEGEAPEYLFDACALPPIPPSVWRVAMFLKGSIWISFWCVYTKNHASIQAQGFNAF